MVSGAPDDVANVENATVFKQRLPFPHAVYSRNTHNTGLLQIFGLDANERRGARKQLRAHLAADRRGNPQDMVPNESHQAQQEEAREEAIDGERHEASLL